MPIGLKRCGDLDANTPTLVPPKAGGGNFRRHTVALVVTVLLFLRDRVEMEHKDIPDVRIIFQALHRVGSHGVLLCSKSCLLDIDLLSRVFRSFRFRHKARFLGIFILRFVRRSKWCVDCRNIPHVSKAFSISVGHGFIFNDDAILTMAES